MQYNVIVSYSKWSLGALSKIKKFLQSDIIHYKFILSYYLWSLFTLVKLGKGADSCISRGAASASAADNLA